MSGDTRPSHNELAHPRNNRILRPETVYVYEMTGCMSRPNCSGNRSPIDPCKPVGRHDADRHMVIDGFTH